MTKLNIHTVTRHEIDYGELETFINDAYGLKYIKYSEYSGSWPYSFVADQECSNDSQHTFTVKPEGIPEYNKEQFEKMKAGKGSYNLTGDILNDLCDQGLIPSGDYLVFVCW